jgi:hypothetical protein
MEMRDNAKPADRMVGRDFYLWRPDFTGRRPNFGAGNKICGGNDAVGF